MGIDASVILIATKVDLLQNKLKSENENFDNRMIEINRSKNIFFFPPENSLIPYFSFHSIGIKGMIEKNKIEMKFEKFKSKIGKEPFFFHFLNNTELDLNSSGINSICEILFNSYDSIEHSVSTNLKHKVVFDTIQDMSKKKKFIELNSFDSRWSGNAGSEKPFLSVKSLKEKLISSKKNVALDASNDIENVLADLHKLGFYYFYFYYYF